MHTNTRIQRYTYIHAYMHEFIHKNKPPPLSHRPQTKGKIIFIDSFNPDISIAPLYVYYSEALPTTVIDSVRVYTPKRYRKQYTVGLYNVYYILLVKDLPKDPGVAARMGFEPTTFRSKGIESTNVPPRPKNINR